MDNEVYLLVVELKLTNLELCNIWTSCSDYKWSKITRSGKEYSRMPLLSKRDNKSTYIGGGGSNRTKIRYPNKK